jgi:hypothetical protein
MRRLALVATALTSLACSFGGSPTTTTVEIAPSTTATTIALIVLPPQPDCFAYQGTGELTDVDLVGYCITGMQLVEAVRACEARGNRPDECLALARAPESEGGDGFTDWSESEISLMFELGTDHIERREAWDVFWDECVEAHGQDTCVDYIESEDSYLWP